MRPFENEKLNIIKNVLNDIQNPEILELGVERGNSTRMFLEICNKNNGKLTSIDINDCSNVSSDSKWQFIKSSDDNFFYIDKYIKNKKFDLLFIDSLHEANHVSKVFYHYFSYVNINGFIFIDDVSWLTYVKGGIQDNDFSERNNRLIFQKILEIYNSNVNNLTLNISFLGSGLAIIKKLNNNLNEEKKISNRMFFPKNILKKIYAPSPKNYLRNSKKL